MYDPKTGAMMIRKGDHNGWAVDVSGASPQVVGSTAYFSAIPEMLDWIKTKLEQPLESSREN